jgi:hypothetical protein
MWFPPFDDEEPFLGHGDNGLNIGPLEAIRLEFDPGEGTIIDLVL